jgi:DNA repair protein RecO (recombination protein O)
VGIEKSSCIVLSVMPYRESSVIATLLSRDHGRLSGIAKGIRRFPSPPVLLERGQIAEIVVYIRPHRELHTLGSVAISGYFPGIRSDLGMLTLRDAAFELVLKSVVATEPHPELFDCLAAFLERLETAAAEPLPVHLLWGFIAGWSHHLGFSMAADRCVRCGGDVTNGGGILSAEQGGLVCCTCSGGNADSPSFIPAAVAAILSAGSRSLPPLSAPAVMDNPGENMRITRLLADYFRYHFEIRGGLKTLDFLGTIMR